jgi:urate oxidase
VNAEFGYTHIGELTVVKLAANNYGKGEVRLVKVVRTPGRHVVRDLTVHVALEGDFEAAHVSGDNTGLPATDTMRNTVYALAPQHLTGSIEAFGLALTRHFVDSYASVSSARVRIEEHPWDRLGSHEHAFQRGSGGTRVCEVDSEGAVRAGIEELLVLKTTNSGWAGFARDRYTTLADTDDRILCTVVTTSWDYAGSVDHDAAWEGAREAILRAFGDHYSPSVQFTLYRMGEAVLESCDAIARVRFVLPNRHHLLYDLARFGIENDHEIFHATTEPYGLIEGTVEREPSDKGAPHDGKATVTA